MLSVVSKWTRTLRCCPTSFARACQHRPRSRARCSARKHGKDEDKWEGDAERARGVLTLPPAPEACWRHFQFALLQRRRWRLLIDLGLAAGAGAGGASVGAGCCGGGGGGGGGTTFSFSFSSSFTAPSTFFFSSGSFGSSISTPSTAYTLSRASHAAGSDQDWEGRPSFPTPGTDFLDASLSVVFSPSSSVGFLPRAPTSPGLFSPAAVEETTDPANASYRHYRPTSPQRAEEPPRPATHEPVSPTMTSPMQRTSVALGPLAPGLGGDDARGAALERGTLGGVVEGVELTVLALLFASWHAAAAGAAVAANGAGRGEKVTWTEVVVTSARMVLEKVQLRLQVREAKQATPPGEVHHQNAH
ncbi:hypothetical protein CVT26_005486 [Gymnopilus dilepis]|uniref:Uncharacterized protein n=1 Tax=Gymnopilus dilepis TaxID=231916 RepID=A0A409WJJ1_9AGAR|nr:hypothetical protein CVT26_005486 [Gymnopilus dilepis]